MQSLLVLAIVIGLQTKGATPDFRLIGRQREQMGDPFMQNPKNWPSDYLDWNCGQTTFPITLAVFPAGAADRRLYIKAFPSGISLYFEVKKNGIVKPMWKVVGRELENSLFLSEDAGTLELMLYRAGFTLNRSTVPASAWPVLRAKKLFAVYQFEPVINTVRCGVIHVNGTKELGGIFPSVTPLLKKPYPYFGFDYPITQEEIDYINSSSTK